MRCVAKMWEFVINEIHEVNDVLERIVENNCRLRLNQIFLKTAMQVGFTLSQATKVLRESRGIALLYFRPLQ